MATTKKRNAPSTEKRKTSPILREVKSPPPRRGTKYIFLEVSIETHTNLKIRASTNKKTIKKYILSLIEADGITVIEPPRKNARVVY